MANWDNISEEGNVEDRRSSSVKTVGGIGLGGLLLVLFVGYFGGADPALRLLDDMNKTQVIQEQQVDTSEFDGKDSYEVFVSKIMGSNDKLWSQAFNNSGLKFSKPKLVLFRGATQSLCGGANSQTGPHYCSLDKTIYLDETFFKELRERFGAKGGDVAQAYVISHEYGHHIQNLLGITKKVRTNTDSIKLELQADCFAGIWASSLKGKNILGIGEINEAIDAASAVGDDRIQKRMTGYIQPETWTHGSSKQRKTMFLTGYKYGDFEKCNTFR